MRVQDLWKSYTAGVAGCSARVWALRGCTLEVNTGERIAIVGRPGAGKTTLLRCLSGERRADAGRIDVHLPHRMYLSSLAQLEELAAIDARRAPALLLVDDQALHDSRQMVTAHGDDAIVVSARDVACVKAHVDRVLLLIEGRLVPFTRTIVRQVAERRVQ